MSRKRAEQAVREALAATERERARLDTLYATAPIGLMYVTPALTVERVNRRIAELHGRSIEDFLGKSLPEVLPPESWSAMQPVFERVLRTGEPHHGLEEEFADPQSPGPSRFFSSDFHPDRRDDGTLRGILVVVHDITVHKQAQRDREVYLKERETYLKELEAKNRELKELAVRDPLTGLYNHRYFEEALAQEWRRFQRTGEPFTVLVMDVDAFKAINDRYGHDAGDRALRQVGATLSTSLRETDLIARTGGDEFVALLPRTDKDHRRAVLEKVGNALKGLRLAAPEGPVSFSISMGYATIPGFPPVTSAAELVRVADQRMYEAKRLASSGKADAG
jgi:diguanylate cyclase (GGDEF)-like protein/PAS domain S-box-containing protein